MSGTDDSRMPPMDSVEVVQGEAALPSVVLQDVAAMEPSEVCPREGEGGAHVS